MSKCSASFAIAFSWLSSHYENSKSTSGHLCELTQILVDFLRAFNRGSFFQGVKFPEHTAKTASLFRMAGKQAMKENLQCTSKYGHLHIYRRISVMYGWQILNASLPYMGIVTICWIIIHCISNQIRLSLSWEKTATHPVISDDWNHTSDN